MKKSLGLVMLAVVMLANVSSAVSTNDPAWKAYVQGKILQNAKDYSAAADQFLMCAETYPELGVFRAWSYVFAADNLKKTGKDAQANKAYMDCVVQCATSLGATNSTSIVWNTFERVKPSLVTPDEYKAWLVEVIKATKATEANALFLGRVKSELGKMQ